MDTNNCMICETKCEDKSVMDQCCLCDLEVCPDCLFKCYDCHYILCMDDETCSMHYECKICKNIICRFCRIDMSDGICARCMSGAESEVELQRYKKKLAFERHLRDIGISIKSVLEDTKIFVDEWNDNSWYSLKSLEHIMQAACDLHKIINENTYYTTE